MTHGSRRRAGLSARSAVPALATLLVAGGCGGALLGAPFVGPEARGALLCPSDMVFVPGGAFLAGGSEEDVGVTEFVPDIPRLPRPRAERAVAPYCIDRHEQPGEGRLPRADVSWLQARVACFAQGKRLCEEDEWTRACGGPLGWLRPYGDAPVGGLCHADVSMEGRYEAILPSGTFAGCASLEGVYDLEGGLSEWAEGRLPPPDPATIMQSDPDAGMAPRAHRNEFRLVLGGTMWRGVYGSGCQARHGHPQLAPVSGDDGFRCCREAVQPPPG